MHRACNQAGARSEGTWRRVGPSRRTPRMAPGCPKFQHRRLTWPKLFQTVSSRELTTLSIEDRRTSVRGFFLTNLSTRLLTTVRNLVACSCRHLSKEYRHHGETRPHTLLHA